MDSELWELEIVVAPHLEEVKGRPVRVRSLGTEADDYPQKHAGMEAETIDETRQMQGRKIRRNRDRERTASGRTAHPKQTVANS